MSWGTCIKGSNNIHPGFPALMSDGRFATTWNVACRRNENLQKQVGITDNYDYRQYLMKHGNQIREANQIAACGQCCGCRNDFKPRPPVKFPHYIFKSCSDKTRPYGYEGSDLKNIYLSRAALQSRLVAPIITQAEMVQTGARNWN